ncbi:hypothetical protein JXD20_04530 [Candidatus Peregrinibacteria bacterium]|nr:hypothetical protein [Candidatus Peregrinibacteria bacterium]
MKIFKHLIIGCLALTAFNWLATDVRAQEEAVDICHPTARDTFYKQIYCDIRSYDNESVDEDLIGILSDQFDMSEELIQEILAGSICETVANYSDDEKEDLPLAIQDACFPDSTKTKIIEGWSVLADITNAYEKEKVIQRSAAGLKHKFKASEIYWDGQIRTIGPPDAPFDLIVDLNLIEIVLFGSKAQWMNDVWSFPGDEDEEGGGEPAPFDGLAPEEEEEEEEGLEEAAEAGPAVTDEMQEGIYTACVPPDHPDADLDYGPGDEYVNPFCGNGTIESLFGEICDDGNLNSGDGCNQWCYSEEYGTNDMCIDPDAVTFNQPGAATGTMETSTGSTGADTADTTQSTFNCPPGTVPRRDRGMVAEEAGPPEEIEQYPEYPGPFIGGTMKRFPETAPPPCPDGYFDARTTGGGGSLSATGEGTLGINIAGHQYDIPRCLPTDFCAEFTEVQDFLFGEDWENDDVLVDIAPTIEALFCVNIIQHNRPLSPYGLIEGCVDCHITAMVDALERALQTNVTPLKNNMNAFGISSAFGPDFSFNLLTATKSKLKYNYTGTNANAIKTANENYTKIERTNTPLPTTVKSLKGPLKDIADQANQIEASREGILEDIETFKISTGVISDQEVGGRIRPLISQMRDSFMNIQARFEGIISATNFDEKEPCE